MIDKLIVCDPYCVYIVHLQVFVNLKNIRAFSVHGINTMETEGRLGDAKLPHHPIRF